MDGHDLVLRKSTDTGSTIHRKDFTTGEYSQIDRNKDDQITT